MDSVAETGCGGWGQPPDSDYKELKELCRELELPLLEHFWNLEVVDLRTGEVVDQYRQRCCSWTRNMYNGTMCQHGGICATDQTTFDDDHLNYKRTDGSLYGSIAYALRRIFSYLSLRGDDEYGILVGTDDAAESFEDYTLIAKVGQGVGAGQLYYYKTETSLLSWSAGARKFTCTYRRFMNNYSGGNIVVREIAMVGYWPASYYVLDARDVLVSPVTVQHYHQLRTQYEMESVVFPS